MIKNIVEILKKLLKVSKNDKKMSRICYNYYLQNCKKYGMLIKQKEVLNMGHYTAQQVAEWFLAYNQIRLVEDGADCISNLKLQKLLYYAQGSYLGITGNVLFDDPIVAWKHGPVVESIYHRYKRYGYLGIPADEISLPEFDPETESILESVYDTFGQFSAWKLRDKTHEETPWRETEQSNVIDVNSIKKYFLENYIEQ